VTAPRRVLANATSLVTRRCSERRFFLRPGPVTNAIFQYVLALAARRYGVLVHAYCVLSNHYHLLVTDPHAQLPAFAQYLDGLVARAVNASIGHFEGFWASGTSYSAVEPSTGDDVLAKAVYVLANPVAAGLVQSGAEWPGLWSSPELVGAAPIGARRPKVFFREDGYLPATVELALTSPPGFTAEAFRDELSRALTSRERQLRRDFAAEGRSFLGVTRVLAQMVWARPSTGEPRFRLSPRIAARDKWKRLEAIGLLREFLSEYRRAWTALRAGVAGVVFPAGTYRLRVLHGVACAAA